MRKDGKNARFEAGKPADPTENMSPENAQKWDDMNEKYQDKFKTADFDMIALEVMANGPSSEVIKAMTSKMAVGDIPADVERYVKEIRESNPDYDDAQVWATAWSVFCKYKSPGSDHCTMDTKDYFKSAMEGLEKIAARSLSDIADEIRNDWKKPYFGAVPYIGAMSGMDSIDDDYGMDSGSSIVAYFLSNSSSWKGDVAKRVKKELQDMLKKSRKYASDRDFHKLVKACGGVTIAEGCPDNLDESECKEWESNTEKYKNVVKDQHTAGYQDRWDIPTEMAGSNGNNLVYRIDNGVILWPDSGRHRVELDGEDGEEFAELVHKLLAKKLPEPQMWRRLEALAHEFSNDPKYKVAGIVNDFVKSEPDNSLRKNPLDPMATWDEGEIDLKDDPRDHKSKGSMIPGLEDRLAARYYTSSKNLGKESGSDYMEYVIRQKANGKPVKSHKDWAEGNKNRRHHDILTRKAEADDDEKTGKFEEGKPTDPTKNMSPEDAAKWKDMNEEHGDKFKTANFQVLYKPLITDLNTLKNDLAKQPFVGSANWGVWETDQEPNAKRLNVWRDDTTPAVFGTLNVSPVTLGAAAKVTAWLKSNAKRYNVKRMRVIDRPDPKGQRSTEYHIYVMLTDLTKAKTATSRVAGFSVEMADAWFAFVGNAPFNKDTIEAIRRINNIPFKDDGGTLHDEGGVALRVMRNEYSGPLTYYQEKAGQVRENIVQVQYVAGMDKKKVLLALQAVGKQFKLKVEALSGYKKPQTRTKAATMQRRAGKYDIYEKEGWEQAEAQIDAAVEKAKAPAFHLEYGKGKSASPTGLYGYTRAIQSSCEASIRKMTRAASQLAKDAYRKDEEVAPFLAAHAKRGGSLAARILVAAMKTIGPKVASEMRKAELRAEALPAERLTKSAARKYGLYGYQAKTASLGLQACTSLRETAGHVASDLHGRKADAHANITGFLTAHAKEARCMYSKMLCASYPDADRRTASVLAPTTVGEWLAWED